MLFFHDYLVGRKTKYFWNRFSSPSFNVDVGVGQGSALSSLILLALYPSLLFHILEKKLKNLKIPVSILSFVDNVLFVAQDKYLMVSNLNLFYSYYFFSSLLKKFGQILKYGKIEVFHFSRSHSTFNSPLLDLLSLEDPVLKPRNTWYYLRFIFNKKLIFQKHVMLQLKDLRISQWKKSYIVLTQENSIENSIQDFLPYILNYHGPCYYFFFFKSSIYYIGCEGRLW